MHTHTQTHTPAAFATALATGWPSLVGCCVRVAEAVGEVKQHVHPGRWAQVRTGLLGLMGGPQPAGRRKKHDAAGTDECWDRRMKTG
eukprot:1158844-Pelagomonas_calceolata.AAC.5